MRPSFISASQSFDENLRTQKLKLVGSFYLGMLAATSLLLAVLLHGRSPGVGAVHLPAISGATASSSLQRPVLASPPRS